ncbi:MAG: hypothetical protein U9Q77_11205 [Candidatus Marinimicrobia bacterium]|nr:hypothetical protein [Candidatus Neomarinimicrobiota bacterium]
MLKMKPFKTIMFNFFLLLLGTGFSSLNAQEQTTLFVSTNINEWEIDGRVSSQMVDSTLAFVFSFDEEYPPLHRPDTVYFDLVSPIDLSSCDSVFIKYSSLDILPSTSSWVAGDVQVLISHSYDPNWTEIYNEDLSHLTGWVHNLKLRLKVAVRSAPEAPGEYVLYNVRFVGSCRN